MVILHNHAGQFVRVELQMWMQLIERAGEHGWRPSGTVRPPVSLDCGHGGEWDPLCYLPSGQAVAGRDAQNMAEALARAGHHGGLVEFLAACRRGGFLICASEDRRESVSSDLLSMNAALQQAAERPLDVPAFRR